MTEREAKAFLNNLKVCIEEHPIVADWLVEIADRKTENSSENPNNCEHITEDGVTCAKYPACDDCLDNPLNKVKGSERLIKGKEQTEPTISKMEQVETMSCQECKHFHENAVMYLDQCDFCFKDCHYEPKDEPQTDWHYDEQDATWYPYKHEDEPQQKSCATCKHALGNWDGESNNCGRCCGADRRFYEPKDEPQNYCDDCLYTDTCDSKEFFYACTSKATISKMEQVDKDINVRSKEK